MEKIKFNTEISYDEKTQQWEAIQHDVHVYGCGNTEDEAINNLIDLIEDSVKEYFENINTYMQIPEWKDKLPYFEALRDMFEQEHEEIFKIISKRDKNDTDKKYN